MNFKEELELNHVFKVVSSAAAKSGQESYVIGGYVRDLILERPSNDIDFVCVRNGIDLATAVARQLGKDIKPVVFKNFGTAMIDYEDMELEFVGARKESYSRDSRKPIVEDGTLEDDQNRRDFTINAMAISLNQHDYGELIDPFDGMKDLKRKMIRTPLAPEITFSDDPLRMLRAIRFATQLSFDIDADTFSGITDNIDRIDIVSRERITDELNKIILSPIPSYGFKLLFQCGLLKRIFPEMVDLHGVEIIGKKAHKDNFYHTLKVLDNVATVSYDLWLRWAAILHDIAKPATKRFNEKAGWTFHGHEDKGARMVPGIFRKLKLPLNDKMRFVQKLVRLHLRPIALVKEEVTDTAIRRLLFEAGDDVEALMKLCKADITSKDHRRVQRYLNNFARVEEKMVEVEGKDKLRNFQPVIDGEYIMKTFEIPPSRVVGEIKKAVREAILEGEIANTFEEAFPFMVAVGEKLGLVCKKDKV
ncbi:MAG: HD domain-containing protein [Bacteroidetes bacterium]|nr:HD domain-containing protein [Bacteroidota bacterium]